MASLEASLEMVTQLTMHQISAQLDGILIRNFVVNNFSNSNTSFYLCIANKKPTLEKIELQKMFFFIYLPFPYR